MANLNLCISALRKTYDAGSATPLAVIEQLYPLLEAETGSFISLAPLEQLQKRCRYALWTRIAVV